MKKWKLVVFEALVAIAGFISFFWAENYLLAGILAVIGVIVGVAQPIVDLIQEKRKLAIREELHQETLEDIDQHKSKLLEEVIRPEIPLGFVVEALLAQTIEDLKCYLKGLHAIDGDLAFVEIRDEFAGISSQPAIASHMIGLAALKDGSLSDASKWFRQSADHEPSWILPWMSWCWCEYELGHFENIKTNHPFSNDISLDPFAMCKDEITAGLNESESKELMIQFQRNMGSLSSLFGVTEFELSREKVNRRHLREVAA